MMSKLPHPAVWRSFSSAVARAAGLIAADDSSGACHVASTAGGGGAECQKKSEARHLKPRVGHNDESHTASDPKIPSTNQPPFSTSNTAIL